MRRCSHCKNLLDDTEFNWKIKGKTRAYACRSCSRNYIQQHYKQNTQYYLDKAKKRKQAIRKQKMQYLGEYLKHHPCVDCGETDILVLEFDHQERSKKTFLISYLIKQDKPFNILTAELEKCSVRCANCHRRKSLKESGSWRLQFAPVA